MGRLRKKEVRKWVTELPKHKQEAISVASIGVASTVPASAMIARSGMLIGEVPVILPIAQVVEPYWAPLMALGVGSALAYDIWHAPHSQVKAKLKKLGKWTEHEIDFIVSHLRHHKKKNPKMMHGVSKHHMRKLKKVM